MYSTTKRLLIALVLAVAVPSIALAQIDLGNYKGYKTNQKKSVPDVIDIRVKSLGGDLEYFTYGKKDKKLEGEYRIALDAKKYAIGNLTEGIANGRWEIYDEESKLAVEATYKAGMPHGPLIRHGHGERHKTVITYDEGKVTHYISYYDNGVVSHEGLYNDKGKVYETTFRYKSGELSGHYLYDDDGKYHGEIFRSISSSGDEYITYDHGKKVGRYRQMFTTGVAWREGHYDENSHQTGYWVTRNRDGSLDKEENFLADKRHGEQKYYHDNGQLKRVEGFKHGVPHGIDIEYEENGDIIRETNYVDGRLHGDFRVFHSGVLWRSGTYRNGKIIMEKEYYDGKLSILRLLDENESLVEVEQYNRYGRKTYRNPNYKKHSSIKLREDSSGVIDVE